MNALTSKIKTLETKMIVECIEGLGFDIDMEEAKFQALNALLAEHEARLGDAATVEIMEKIGMMEHA